VLVVDDEPAIRLLCRVNLELEGFRVLEAGNVDEARERLAAEDVGVVLVDVHIGPVDGRDFARELRAHDPPRRVALLTGSIDLSAEEREGADAVVYKPFTIDELVETVQRLSRAVDSSQ